MVSPIGKICMVCCLLLVGACSSTTFFYNRLDFILPWYLDDYVELDRDQERYLDELLQPFLAWHRSDELPRYVALLESVEASLDQPLSAGDVAAISLEFEEAWFRLQEEFLDWLLELGARLTDEQIQSFLDELWRDQEKYQDKYLQRTDREYREDSYDSLLDNLQDYMGRLDKGQRALLSAASAELERSDQIWLDERAAWLKKLGGLLQRQPGWQLRLREAIAQRGADMSQEYRRTYEHNLGVIHATLAQVLNRRTQKQDRHLRRELSTLRADLETLNAQGRAAPEAA